MTAVSDTSPLILLEKTEHLWLLERLFQTVIIPPSVSQEWLRPAGQVIPSWLSVRELSPDAQRIADSLYPIIDRGEAEAIAIAGDIKAEWLILDDLKGRNQAKAMNLPVVGTLGILVAAKRKGIIGELKPVLDLLKKQRYFISEDVLVSALDLVGEQ